MALYNVFCSGLNKLFVKKNGCGKFKISTSVFLHKFTTFYAEKKYEQFYVLVYQAALKFNGNIWHWYVYLYAYICKYLVCTLFVHLPCFTCSGCDE